MRKLKFLIVANNNWQSWPEKIKAIQDAFLPHIELTIDLVKTQFNVIPFTDYGEGRVGVEYDFYNKNVTVKANGYDIVEFVVPLSQWQMPQKNRGFRTDRDAGPIELQVGADENEMTEDGPIGSRVRVNHFVVYTLHELSHACYMLTGQEDKTHFFYDKYWDNFLPYVLADLSWPDPHEADLKSTFFQKIQMLILQFFNGDKKQAEIIGEELFKISEELKPNPPPAPNVVRKLSKLELFCNAIQAHETGGNPNSLPSRLLNPGAFRFAEWQRKFGGVPHSSGYTRFASYAEGYAALRAFLRSACSVYGKTYQPTMTLYQFFAKYAPDADQGPGMAKSKQYAEFVADRIGVPPSTQLRSLV
jgi:hypothetical protein